MDLELAGKRALVTGSYRGTGAGVARVLAREGASVLVHGFEQAPAEAVAASIRAQGLDAQAVAGDIRTDEGARAVADACGEIDVLVNNYGVAEGGSWESPTADWIDIYQKNVLSGVRLVQAFTPGMTERGWGRVIFVSTVGYVRPNARMPHYYASKMALVNMTVSLAKQLANTGITVNCVSPGLIATDEVVEIYRKRAEREGEPTDWPSLERRMASGEMGNPAGIVGTPEDIGQLIAFLASDRARYVNAANLRIDGGTADSIQ
ncbi:MAG TPA: SDR family oxidoreductase [Myxococcota bacterium]|nr:SDR family oxidoreductase [Myxococcota bacterium]